MSGTVNEYVKGETKRQRLEAIGHQLRQEKESFVADWRENGEYVAPRRPRFMVSDTNKGGRRNHKIIDSTATLALRTLKSGMMGGITSPARPWMRLDTPDPDMANSTAVSAWLYKTTEQMLAVFLKSNLYNSMPILYGDMANFGTGAMLVEEDLENVLSTYVFPIGSYEIAIDDKLRVNTFRREFQLTVSQVVQKFGNKNPDGTINWKNFNWENFSSIVENAIKGGQWQHKIEIVHIILPNDMYDPKQLGPKGKKYSSIYYEKASQSKSESEAGGAKNGKLLRESGYDLFPVLCPRWEVTGEDAYGTDCPTTTCIGDIKALQTMHKRKAQAIEKMVNPPMTGPSSLKNTKTSLLPGDMTYQDVREGQLGFRPIHEVNFRINDLRDDIREHQDRINKAYYADLFLMMSMDDRNQPATATEINEKHEEKMLAIGPVLEQLNQDVLDPLVDIAFSFMVKQGRIDPAPPELHGIPLKVEYTSIMAQAQKLLGLASTEKFFRFAQLVLPVFPEAADAIDAIEGLREYGDKSSLAPKILRDPGAIQQIQENRAKAQQQAQQAQMMEQQSKAAKNLAQAPTDENNALTALMQQGNAGNVSPIR